MNDKHAQFDGSVPSYYDHYLGPVLFEPFAVDLAARVAVPPDAAVLEIACGTGILTRALCDALPASARMVATDLNEPMLTFARAKLSTREQVSWAVADASALPFAADAFDATVCQFGLMFVPDKVRALESVRDVLKPGGALYFNVWGAMEANTFQYITQATMARLFPDDPPGFYEVAFNLARIDHVDALLRAAGFDDVTQEAVATMGTCATAHELALGLVYGNPIITAIRARGTMKADAVVEAIATEIEKVCGTSPTRARMEAVAVTARPNHRSYRSPRS